MYVCIYIYIYMMYYILCTYEVQGPERGQPARQQ